MTTLMIDWQKGADDDLTEVDINHFRIVPLPIITKDKFELELEARIVMEIDDFSTIINTFHTFPAFITNGLNNLIVYFFWYKERNDIMTNRLEIKKELIDELQERLTKYGVKISDFVMVSMMPYEPRIKNDKNDKKDLDKESIIVTDSLEIGSDNRYIKTTENSLKRFSLINFMLIIVSSIIILVNIEYNDPFRFSTFISILVLIICITQYFEIRKVKMQNLIE